MQNNSDFSEARKQEIREKAMKRIAARKQNLDESATVFDSIEVFKKHLDTLSNETD